MVNKARDGTTIQVGGRLWRVEDRQRCAAQLRLAARDVQEVCTTGVPSTVVTDASGWGEGTPIPYQSPERFGLFGTDAKCGGGQSGRAADPS